MNSYIFPTYSQQTITLNSSILIFFYCNFYDFIPFPTCSPADSTLNISISPYFVVIPTVIPTIFSTTLPHRYRHSGLPSQQFPSQQFSTQASPPPPKKRLCHFLTQTPLLFSHISHFPISRILLFLVYYYFLFCLHYFSSIFLITSLYPLQSVM